MFRYQPGDVLVQYQGEPWPTLARVFTGSPYCHAQMVSRVEDVSGDGRNVYRYAQRVYVLENHVDGLQEKEAWNLEWFLVVRYRCDQAIKDSAIAWLRERKGAIYGYRRLIWIGLSYRLGHHNDPVDYDSETFDQNDMVCSEAITRALWRNGFDPAPAVSNRNTLPVDLLNFELADVFRDGLPVTACELG